MSDVSDGNVLTEEEFKAFCDQVILKAAEPPKPHRHLIAPGAGRRICIECGTPFIVGDDGTIEVDSALLRRVFHADDPIPPDESGNGSVLTPEETDD